MVREWCKVTTGDFHFKEILNGRINFRLNPKAYDKLRADIEALCKEDFIESVGKKDGYYRLIQDLPTPVNWQLVDSKQDFPIVLPFDLRKYVWIEPNTSIIVAGSKDAGKTAFAIQTVKLSMNKVNTIFLTNMENGAGQIKRKFEAMGVDMSSPPFKTYPVVDNFHQAIKEPNTLYVIDYIDVPESGEFYMIAPALARIQIKLRNSVAVIGLQKKKSSDLAFGGEQTLKKASLYLAMNPGRIKIVSAKVPADPKILPKNMQWSFKYDEAGTNFLNPQHYYGGEE